MQGSSRRVLVALSGGVDSSAAVCLLSERGYRCRGVYMITCAKGLEERHLAEEAADKLGIGLDVLDLRGDFERIIDYFCDEYSTGRTPNPCVLCNKVIKFGLLCDYAAENGFDYLATGHYARKLEKDGKFYIAQGIDPAKEQSYVLAMINREVLPNILLPMGEMTKPKAREIARKAGLNFENRPESQEICFVPDDDYVRLLEERRSGLAVTGDVVDTQGRVLGTHNGVHKYTIGQRRGLGIAMTRPVYVTDIDAESNTVTLGDRAELLSQSCQADSVNLLAEAGESSFAGLVKIRYNHKGEKARVRLTEGNRIRIDFERPVSAVTPGQTAVCYVKKGEDYVIACAGQILKTTG